MDMVLKKLGSKVFYIIILLFFIQCKERNKDIKEIGLKYDNYELLSDFNDEAGVCSFKEYKLFINKDHGGISKNSSFVKQLREDEKWNVEDWSNNIDTDFLDFIYSNFKYSSLKENIGNNENYYLYGYKGKKNDLFAIKLFIFIPNKNLLYHFEIIP